MQIWIQRRPGRHPSSRIGDRYDALALRDDDAAGPLDRDGEHQCYADP
jgi:hypothetical protein